MLRVFQKIFSFIFSRLFLVALMLLIQIVVMCAGVVYFSRNFFYLYMVFVVWSILTAINVVSNKENPSYKITWLVAILCFPTIGWLFYLMLGNKRMPKKLRKQIENTRVENQYYLSSNRQYVDALCQENHALWRQASYIFNTSGYPMQKNQYAEYYPVGEDMFASMIKELKKAERYIFLEYFIIQPGKMWDSVFEVLQQKAAEGVEVRLMYDDLGCINTLPKKYNQRIRDAGIQLQVFNPFRPRVNVLMNHRDHRKITVVDGCVAFCGGINLADEYINAYERFGHWKDTGVMLRGEAAWSFAFMFLQQWRFCTGEAVDFDRYSCVQETEPPHRSETSGKGYVLPFGESPLDQHNVTEMTYLGVISKATQYVYITTPYLVIDNEMEVALCTAAQSGVDVRIITPYRYDKWYVHILTRSHYERLIQAGVKIYEYSPGFIHGKMFVADDKICMVGTSNMDFRSFYLHFECSVAFFLDEMVQTVKKDILQSQRCSHQVLQEEVCTASVGVRLMRAVLKLFAPLM